MENQYWEQKFSDKYSKVLKAAVALTKAQRDTKKQFEDKDSSIFDVPLTDPRRYRKEGKFITPFHSTLYQKYQKKEKACPIYEMSIWQKQVQYNSAYKAHVYSNEKKQRRDLPKNLLDLNEAYEEFMEYYLNDVFYNQGKVYKVDEYNLKVIKNLISYFTHQQDCPLALNKGICLYGGVGTGKSTIMRELARFTKDKDLITQFDFIYMDDVYTDCDSSGLESLNSYKFRRCCFDDIGMRAENNVNNFGTKINAYRELVRRQYNRYTRPIPSLSHYTTNIQYNNKDFQTDLRKNFGARELDRFNEMCNFVELGGKSRRG